MSELRYDTISNIPQYKCHKIVRAFKIQEVRPNGDSWMLVADDLGGGDGCCISAEYVSKHKPQVGGYYVVYEDGYKSFSPAKAFEDGYTLIVR